MTFDPSGLTAYVNGEYVDASKASVSIFDHGFLYGDGVFEGLRVFDGGLFRADLHMARIARSARTIGLTAPDDLLDIIGSSPCRQFMHRPQPHGPYTMTGSPGAKPVSPGPIFSTQPAFSCPRVNGSENDSDPAGASSRCRSE